MPRPKRSKPREKTRGALWTAEEVAILNNRGTKTEDELHQMLPHRTRAAIATKMKMLRDCEFREARAPDAKRRSHINRVVKIAAQPEPDEDEADQPEPVKKGAVSLPKLKFVELADAILSRPTGVKR